MNVKIAWIV